MFTCRCAHTWKISKNLFYCKYISAVLHSNRNNWKLGVWADTEGQERGFLPLMLLYVQVDAWYNFLVFFSFFCSMRIAKSRMLWFYAGDPRFTIISTKPFYISNFQFNLILDCTEHICTSTERKYNLHLTCNLGRQLDLGRAVESSS